MFLRCRISIEGQNVTLALQCQALTFLTVQKTREATQHFDRVADVPVVLQRQEPIIHTVQKTAESVLTEWQM